MASGKPRRKSEVQSTKFEVRATALTVALLGASLLAAQSPTDTVVRLEQQRIQAVRTGGDLERFYSPAYRGITAAGQPESRAQIQHTPNTDAARRYDAAVELHGDTAIVTGIEGNSETGDRDRFLRIWTKDNGVWTIVAAQTTWIGNRTGAAPPSGPLPSAPGAPAFEPRTPVEEALWKSQDALMRSFSEADPASYRLYSTEQSLRMTTGGDAIARDQWLDTIGKRQKGPLAVVDEVRLATYGDVGIVTLRGHEANPTRQSWIYLRQDGTWKLHLRYTTLIRQ
jgi:hypothetical protein